MIIFRSPPHYIKPNKRTFIPQQLVFFDTEAWIKNKDREEEHLFRIAVARYIDLYRGKDQYYVFKNPGELWSTIAGLAKPKKRLWVFAHNLHYDWNIAGGFKHMKNLGFKLLRAVISSQYFMLKYTKDTMTINFVDTLNIFKTSIAEMGKLIGLPKLSVDFHNADDDELITYCKRDVEILSTFFLNFLRWWRDNNLGEFAPTVAGLAFNAYRHRFMRYKILSHRNPEALELEEKSYKGGRNEAFYIGTFEGDFYKLDINSLYPYVMLSQPLPTKLKDVLVKPPLDILKNNKAYICEAYIETNEPAYGVKRNGKLIFPVGRIHDVFTTPELRYAYTHGHLRELIKCSEYSVAPIFTNYVRFFYNLKREAEEKGDKLGRSFAKLMMNSLYGKFAQRVYERVKIPLDPVIEYGSFYIKIGDSYKKILVIDGEPYMLSRERLLFRDANIAIASHITAYGRMILWGFIQQAGRENVYYCDTDSLFVNKEGYERLKKYTGSDIGLFKLEKHSTKLTINTLKDYCFGEECKTKGISPEAKPIDTNTYLDKVWLRTLSLLTRGAIDKVIIEYREKKLNRDYDKGKIRDGMVEPLEVEEW